jgi:RNA recognition motif-containing protein
MNIFVAGLSYQISDADLKELFEEYGDVSSAKIITDRETRRSKGYGFVEMADENGQNAIDELNGAEYDGRTLSVSVARPRTENDDRRGGGFHRGGNNRGGGYGNRDNRDRNRY